MAQLSLEKIADINRRDLGVKGRFYEDVEGYIYIGKGTRLFKYAKCSEVSLDISSIPADTVCKGMIYLDEKIIEEKTISALVPPSSPSS